MFNVRFDLDLSGLEKMKRNAKQMSKSVSWRELLTDEFLSKYTEFNSFSEIEHLDVEELLKPEFIARTRFKSFEELQNKAISESKALTKLEKKLFKGV